MNSGDSIVSVLCQNTTTNNSNKTSDEGQNKNNGTNGTEQTQNDSKQQASHSSQLRHATTLMLSMDLTATLIAALKINSSK